MTYDPVIVIDSLTKYFNRNVGIEDISLEVKKGEVFGFIGPNGSGKTTTIRIMVDLLRPTSGRVMIFGKDISHHSVEILRKCCYLPGNFAAYENISAREFLDLIGGIRKCPPVIQKSLLERFNITDHELSIKIKYLSHGTLQKTGIIMAFVFNPELLILDEPTTGLDPMMQEEFYKLIHEYSKNGNTVFISSHNLSEIEKICSTFAFIRKGKLAGIHSIEDLQRSNDYLLEITFSHHIADMGLRNAKLLGLDGLKYTYSFSGQVAGLLKVLTDLPINDIIIRKRGLGEMIMEFYKDQPSE